MAFTDGRRDTGIGTGKLGGWLRSRGVKAVAIILVVLIFFALCAAMFMMYRDQERKLNELLAEKQRLSDTVDKLSRENERLENKLEYTKSLEGLLRYARDNLGYIYPDDTRYDDDGN